MISNLTAEKLARFEATVRKSDNIYLSKTSNEVNDYRDDSFDSRYESVDEGGSDEPHMYPDDGDYDPSSDF